MPAARPSSSKSKKLAARDQHPTSKLLSSNGAKRVTCHAWWCNSTFTRRADMLKHVGSEHFGKRFYCIVCNAVMKQQSNLDTHLNAHFSNQCTLCSCGRSFTDPSACTRHRDATGHKEGTTYRKIRPTLVKAVPVQHVAGLGVTIEMISEHSFVPPSFDESYHLRGMHKRKSQEKYSPAVYQITDRTGIPTLPSTLPAGAFAAHDGYGSTNGTPTAEYQGPPPTGRPAHTQPGLQVDSLGFHTDFSYDVELPQEHTAPTCMPTEVNSYPQQYQESYTMDVNNNPPPSPQQFAEPYVPQAYLGMHPHLQAPNPPSHSVLPPPPDVPFHDVFGEMAFGIPVPEQFFYPSIYPSVFAFNNHYHTTSAAY